jgi:hypothetical protein
MTSVVYVGLGSNLGHPRRRLARALRALAQLPRTQLVAASGNYLSAPLRALWSFPLSLGGVTADQAAGLARTLAAVSYLPAATSVGTSLNASAGPAATIQVSLSSGLATTLLPFVATDDAVQRVLSLMFVSLAVIAAVVVLLGPGW